MIGSNILFGIFIVFCASVLEGLMGFGYIMLASPLLMFIFLPKMVVPIVLMQSTFNEFIMIYFLRRQIKKNFDIQRISKLAIASMIGIPLGTLILVTVQEEIIKILTGIVIIIFSISQLLGYRWPINNENIALIITGSLSGILAGSVAMSGPPVILFLTNLKITKDCFKI
ncbi:MAG: sulfite exporter TauE/SafE family protein, partial [Candidatus Atribacteria bacterium]|nr:sulfite exporter TauE/SafE family protein [Candidatus Atribacteria bacterium]